MTASTPLPACPCGSGATYDACCGVFHHAFHDPSGERGAGAPTAEALMRSRFAAFALGRTDYLLGTWHPSTRPGDLELDPGTTWTRLRILSHTAGGPDDATGTVAFRAHFTHDGDRGAQSENSRFVRDEGRWSYLDGDVVPGMSVQRTG
ncbi:SEC-C motif-containing protein [Sanguibacter gelidistatuariae]|uniref:UPF0225 protein SAMN05216410_2761 n=1 Tax=Sanguibacter gelidistatuariae TaxID=1814289 RepID=A0A1G6RS35_9MICO|nr:YchJ family protein [Sanguibacter gelidistatuariae]SDD07368.1 SEC-C motif-containing protein [Sanguibacter gelidistatuariae]